MLLCCILAASAHADEIVFTSGGRLSCEVLEETDEHIRVRLAHGTMLIERSRVAEVRREASEDYLKREARARLKAGSTRSAVELFERALREKPGDAAARRGLLESLEAHARSLLRRYRLAEAQAVVERLGTDSPAARELAAAIAKEQQAGARLLGEAVQAYKRGDFAGCLKRLDAWRLRRPVGDAEAALKMAAAHLGAGYAALEQGALRKALDHFRSADSFKRTDEADEVLGFLRPIEVLEALKQGAMKKAGRLIDSMKSTYPDRAVPLFLRAVQHHLAGEVQLAVAGYADAARVARGQGEVKRGITYELVQKHALGTLRLAIARPPQEGAARWREFFLEPLRRYDGATHFTVYAASEQEAEELGATADRLYEQIANDLLGGVPPAPKAELVLHPSRKVYVTADPIPPGSPLAALTVMRNETAGVCYESLGADGKPVVRVEAYPQPRFDLDTLPHELVHVVQRRGLNVHRRGHWLDEGLATLYESERSRSGRVSRLKEPMPLRELLALRSTPPSKLALFYNQSSALAQFLRGHGTQGAWRLFLDAYATRGFERAILDAYDIKSVDLLERMWLEWLSKGGR